MSVDPELARWLREGVKFSAADSAAIEAAWGELARASEIQSALATKAGADAEAARQLALLAAPIAIDEHVVAGRRHDLLGRAVTLSGDRFGYEAGAVAFVIAAEELDGVEQTKLTVIRKLS